MKSLRIIQTLFKVARVIALIFFILSIIGASGCFLAVIILASMSNVVLYDGQTLAQIMANNNTDINAVIASVVFGMLGCGFSIFLSKYSELFFLKELKAGTPFTREMAKEMRRYGLVYIIVTISATVIMSIAYGITAIFVKSLRSYDFSFHIGSIVFGLFMIILSVFCDYGAELQETKENEVVEEIKEEKTEE